MRKAGRNGAREIRAAMISDVDAHYKGSERTDHLTLLMVKFTEIKPGNGKAGMTENQAAFD